MTEPTPPESAASNPDTAGVEVTALLVCREIQNTKTGVNVREVLEVVPVLQLPGEAGPLTFAAFLRSERAGEAKVSFRVHPLKDPTVTLITLPGRLLVQKGYEGRQTVVGAGFKTLKVNQSGWYGVEFRVGETILARARFLVGVMQRTPAAPGGSSPS